MTSPQQLLIDIAREDVGKREVTQNRAPWIAKYWPETSYPDGMANREPYCAAAMCYVLAEFIRRLADEGELRKTLGMGSVEAHKWRCKSARAFGWKEWALKKNVQMFGDSMIPKPGDFVVFDFSHAGLVVKPVGKTQMQTIEMNTNEGGSREGDGCMEKIRQRSLAQCFIRIIP